MADLFTHGPRGNSEGPLADRMRPQALDDLIGQDHILGPGRLLRRAIQADRLSSLIFYGPPGSGKTSLARVIANSTRAYFESLNAVLTGIKDIREAIDRSDERLRLYGRRTILFVDEVHRWNKAQQDALLPWVENGTVILIGATTENPFFEVNSALVSRSRIFQLKSLTSSDLLLAANRALTDTARGYGRWKVAFAEGALEHLVEVAGGDARSLLNAMELAIETSEWRESRDATSPGTAWPPPDGAEIYVSFEAAEESIQRRATLYDRDGDYHFDTISAFIKSLRGSDPDAALYWLAKMVYAGEDPAFIFRRMIILASEDVGMADPQALSVVISCAEAFDRIGFPEGNFPLAHACLYLATAPKSNTALSFFDALGAVEKEEAEVPNHLRDASRDKEAFRHGEGYLYPHAYRDHWAAQQYLPTALQGKIFYTPAENGYEGRIREEILRKREIQGAVILGDASMQGVNAPSGEYLSWSASSKSREGWLKRLESGRSALLLRDRDTIFAQVSIKRQDRILICAASDGLLLWESLRKAPEGLSVALVETAEEREALLTLSAVLDPVEQPSICISPGQTLPLAAEAQAWLSCSQFDHILAREPWRRGLGDKPVARYFKDFAARASELLVSGGSVAILQSPPLLGQRLSKILQDEAPSQGELAQKLERAESAYFSNNSPDLPASSSSLWRNWNAAVLEEAFQLAGFRVSLQALDQREERLLSERDIGGWFDSDRSSWGSAIHASLGDEDFQVLKSILLERIKQGPVVWSWKSLLLSAHKIA